MPNETDALNEAINRLEAKRSKDLETLKEQVDSSIDSLKPVNLIKNTFDKITSTPRLKNNILGSAIGIGTGLLSKKLMIGGTHNPIKKIVGTMMQFAIAKIVSKHAYTAKLKGENMVHRFLKKRRESREDVQDFNSKL